MSLKVMAILNFEKWTTDFPEHIQMSSQGWSLARKNENFLKN